MVLKLEVGQKWRYIGSGSDFYTRGAIYKVLSAEDADGRMGALTDNYGGPHHWSSDETFYAHFERAEGPVRTVTRKEIVPGYYGFVKVAEAAMTGHAHISIHACEMDAPKLRAAAATLIEIADALGDTK